jgi:hypothetical protein
MNGVGRYGRRVRLALRRLLGGRDKGSVAITFLLSLLVFIPAVGVTVQYALLVNARLTMSRAMAAAARSAMVSLPTDSKIDGTDGSTNVDRAAFMVLESVSPRSPDASEDAQDVATALQSAGLTLPPDYAKHYAYAEQATGITIQRIISNGQLDAPFTEEHFERLPGPRVRITMTYNYLLTVPMFNMLLGRGDNVAGVDGRFWTFTISQDVQLSDGRETNSDLPLSP